MCRSIRHYLGRRETGVSDFLLPAWETEAVNLYGVVAEPFFLVDLAKLGQIDVLKGPNSKANVLRGDGC